MEFKPIDSAPKDKPVILANFDAACMITGAPHVWCATYVTKWVDGNGNEVNDSGMWCESSYAAMNDNGEPTHWCELPEISKSDK